MQQMFGIGGNMLCMGVWQGVAMDCLKFHPDPLCPTLLHPVGRGGWPAGLAACGRLYVFGHPTPYAYDAL
jgi:hypothetical protein